MNERLSQHWDRAGDLLLHWERGAHVPDHINPRDSNAGGHRTEVVHHGHADDPIVLELLRADASIDAVVEAIQQAHHAAQVAAEPQPTPPEEVVAHTGNGREIRKTASGTFVVQPHDDNYWIEVGTIEDAHDAYHHPEKHRA